MTESCFVDTRKLVEQNFENWKSTDISSVNGNTVRHRLMKEVTTKWHSHTDSDELFIVQSGTITIETEYETQQLEEGTVYRVEAGVKHHIIVKNYASILVIDAIKSTKK